MTVHGTKFMDRTLLCGRVGTKHDPEHPGEGWLADDEAAPSCASGMSKFDCASGSEEPPDDAKALRGPTHKWESLVVWVVAWGGSFWLLVCSPYLRPLHDFSPVGVPSVVSIPGCSSPNKLCKCTQESVFACCAGFGRYLHGLPVQWSGGT